MPPSMSSVIAERVLTFGTGPEAKVIRILVGKPFPSSDRKNFSCPTQIIWIGDEKIRPIDGVDSMQALQLALRFLSSELDIYRADLYWYGTDSRYCGDDIGL
jgi:hypothetical protein